MVHDTVTVYYLLQKLLTEYVKAEFTHFHKVFYFSDGSGAQYKNFKNFTSLLLQEQNFDLKAEWHFFATSQRKKIHGVISFFIRTEHGDQVTQFLQPRFSNSPKFNGTHKNYQFIPVGNNIQMSCVSRDSGRAGLINTPGVNIVNIEEIVPGSVYACHDDKERHFDIVNSISHENTDANSSSCTQMVHLFIFFGQLEMTFVGSLYRTLFPKLNLL